MNQILYKGEIFGGVGEDVTNKQYDNVTIHNPITDQDETYSPVGGENAEIFNCYKGNDRNIASTPCTTIIGKSNKDLLTQSYSSGYNMIGGYLNINKGQRNTIFGQSNFVQGMNCSVFGDNNIAYGERLFISGINNIIKTISITDKKLQDSFIMGLNNKMLGDTQGNFIIGENNTLGVGGSSGGTRAHTLICGLNNVIDVCAESFISGCNNNVLNSEYSFIFGEGNNFTNCDCGIYGGQRNTITTDGQGFFLGSNSVIGYANGYSLIIGSDIKANAITESSVLGKLDTNGSVIRSFILGHNNTTKENNAYIKETGESIKRSFIFGIDNIISKIEDTIIIGNSNNIQNIYAQNENDHSYNLTIGFNNSSSNSKASITIGDNNLINSNIENGCIIGKNNIIRYGSNGSFLLGEGNISENGAISSIILGKNNTNTNGAELAVSIGNNLYNNFINGTVLGHYNEYPRVNGLVTGKLLVLGNGYVDNQDVIHRSNCLEINEDGSQEIILQDKTLTSTLGIGKVKIKQEKIIFESLKENSNNEKETVEFTFEDLQSLKNIAPAQNINNTPFPQI